MEQKIAFFDIDGTITSEVDGSIPQSTIEAINRAKDFGNLMFINSGRCMQNIEQRFKNIGFDGYICGCGTNIYLEKESSLKEILHIEQPSNVIKEILLESRKYDLDILFESKRDVCFDMKKDFFTSGAKRQYDSFIEKGYPMNQDPGDENFTCDKFVIWFKNINDLSSFRKVSDKHFDCIDRGGNFREFVPIGYSKATGIKTVLEYYHLPLSNAYAFGDSNNDLSMLTYVPNSIAMGNSFPQSLFNCVTYVTTKSSENGIENALNHFNFFIK